MSLSPYVESRFPRLPALPRPVHFVTREARWQPLIREGFEALATSPQALAELYRLCVSTGDIWSAQAYLDLKQCGLDVHLSERPVPGEICVVPYWYLPPRTPWYDSYVVALHHDSPRPVTCEQRITINERQANGVDAHFIAHRPQPNLRLRDPARGQSIRTLAFKGEASNLHESFRSEAFLADLRRLGVELTTHTEFADRVFDQWADYRDVDLVIAVRNNTHFDINLKPALKLINAWMAGVPALLSPEPSYRRLRRSALDYIEVIRPEHALAAIRHLQANPAVYRAMVDNGYARAEEFLPHRHALRWAELFRGPIEAGFRRWAATPSFVRRTWWPVRHGLRMAGHWRHARVYRGRIHEGRRILTDVDPAFALELPVLDGHAPAEPMPAPVGGWREGPGLVVGS